MLNGSCPMRKRLKCFSMMAQANSPPPEFAQNPLTPSSVKISMTNGSCPPPIHSERMREYFGWTDMGLEMSVCACQPPPQYCDSPIAAPRAPVSPDLIV